MRLVIEYILCYSSAFGLGFIAGAGAMMLLQKRDRRRQAVINKRMNHMRRDYGRKKYYG